jgi:hypothetical protein
MRLPRYARNDMVVSEQAKNNENILTFSPLNGNKEQGSKSNDNLAKRSYALA